MPSEYQIICSFFKPFEDNEQLNSDMHFKNHSEKYSSHRHCKALSFALFASAVVIHIKQTPRFILTETQNNNSIIEQLESVEIVKW